jgi:anaerobic ribonucleoside-triphosphate reductase activating protein
LQGCHKRCSSCLSSEFLPLRGGASYSIEQVSELVRFHHSNYPVQGLTISGGEPMVQWAALEMFLGSIKKEIQTLNVILFTGYTYSGEGRFFDAPSLTVPDIEILVDLLIDGEYVEANNNGEFMRGSGNQRHLFFNPKFKTKFQEYQNKSKGVRSMQLFAATQFLAGIPKSNIRQLIKKA